MERLLEYKILPLPNGEYIQIKFEEEGITYDRFEGRNNL